MIIKNSYIHILYCVLGACMHQSMAKYTCTCMCSVIYLLGNMDSNGCHPLWVEHRYHTWASHTEYPTSTGIVDSTHLINWHIILSQINMLIFLLGSFRN